MTLEIALLGTPTVRRDGEPVSFDTRKAMALLAHLALDDRPRARESLCELLWPRHDPDRSRGALRRTLSTLRAGIGPESLKTIGDTLEFERGPGVVVDVDRFHALSGERASEQDLVAAVGLFGGPFLEGFTLRDSPEFDDWQAAEGDALRRQLCVALRRLVEKLEAQGRWDRAIPYARRWLDADPIHEPGHRALIRLFAQSGDRGAALNQYRECARILSRELGVPPLEETIALYERISQGDPPAGTAESAPRPAKHGRPRSLPELPLIGRERELETLAGALSSSEGRLVVIEGEAGIGKTRLADELVAQAVSAKVPVLRARCHEDEVNLSYGGIIELIRSGLATAPEGWHAGLAEDALADASSIAPELGRLADSRLQRVQLSGPGAQARLLGATAAVLEALAAGPEGGAIVVDDVHAADAATIDAIAYLARRIKTRRLLLLLTWRNEAIAPGSRLRRLALELEAAGAATILAPHRLTEDEVAALVGVGSADDEHGLQRTVFLESEGLPLFVVEYLNAIRTGSDIPQGSFPGEVQNLLSARLAGLTAVTRQVLGAASVIGRSFDYDTLRQASGRSENEIVDALEELELKGIVVEQADLEPPYGFSHEQLRRLAYSETGAARRRLLHGRIARALGAERPESAAPMASHLRLAGDWKAAALSHRRAAEHAAALHANADAAEHLEAALALSDGDTAEIHERLGELRVLLGDYAGALASFESAAAEGDPERTGHLEHRLGEVHLRRGEWDRAEARMTAALEALPEEAMADRARVLADLSLTSVRAGRAEQARELAGRALATAELTGDPQARAQVHNLLGALARNEGQLQEAERQLEQSLALAEELGDGHAQAAALNNWALVRRDSGDIERALELTGQALKISAAHGDRHREAALENNIADLYHQAGSEERSMEHLKRAVTIFSEVGADEATRLPEIWKLVSW